MGEQFYSIYKHCKFYNRRKYSQKIEQLHILYCMFKFIPVKIIQTFRIRHKAFVAFQEHNLGKIAAGTGLGD